MLRGSEDEEGLTTYFQSKGNANMERRVAITLYTAVLLISLLERKIRYLKLNIDEFSNIHEIFVWRKMSLVTYHHIARVQREMRNLDLNKELFPFYSILFYIRIHHLKYKLLDIIN